MDVWMNWQARLRWRKGIAAAQAVVQAYDGGQNGHGDLTGVPLGDAFHFIGSLRALARRTSTER
jgi:hypothetical protein